MGHASIATTGDIYGHLLPGWQKEAANAFARAMRAGYSEKIPVKFCMLNYYGSKEVSPTLTRGSSSQSDPIPHRTERNFLAVPTERDI